MNIASLPAIGSARLPSNYEAAKVALAECQNLDECKDWADKAAALASYARQAQDDELERRAQRIRARAVRRSGELLKQIETAQGARTDLKPLALEGQKFRADAAREAGLSAKQARTAVGVANVPEADFEAQVESDAPPTLSALAQQGIKPKPRPVLDLKGRDPRDFNRALHFLGSFENYAREIEAAPVDAVVAILTDAERARLRGFINRIDAIHDRIMTRV